MSFFLEIGSAYSDHHDSPDEKHLSSDMPDLSNLIPVSSMEYGHSKTIRKGHDDTTVSNARTHELVFTKAFDANSNNILHHSTIRKTKELRIYVTESAQLSSSLGAFSSVAGKASSLNIKAVITFGDAHISRVHTSGSGMTGGNLFETIHVNYSTVMIRNMSSGNPSSMGYDYKNAKTM